MKKKRTVLILTGVVAVLLLVYVGLGWYSSREEEKEKKQEEEARVYLTQMGDPAALAYTDGEQSLAFSKEGEKWVYEADTEIPLDFDAVETMADTASNLEAARELEDPDDLEDYGLDSPAYRVEVTDENGEQAVILIGNSAGENYYAMKEGEDTVYTISDELSGGLQFDIGEFVKNDEVPGIGSGNLKKVTVVQDGETTEYSDEEDIGELAGGFGVLTLSDPVNYHADEEALKQYGLDESTATVITAVYEDADSEEEQTFTVLVGKRVPDDEASKESGSEGEALEDTAEGDADEDGAAGDSAGDGTDTAESAQKYLQVQGSGLVYEVDDAVIENMMTGSEESEE